MNMELNKCKYQNGYPYFSVTYVVGTHRNCLVYAIPICTYHCTAYVLAINEFSL